MSIEEKRRKKLGSEVHEVNAQTAEMMESQAVAKQQQEQLLQQILDQQDALKNQLDSFKTKHDKLTAKVDKLLPTKEGEEEPEEVSEIKLIIQDNEDTVAHLNQELKKLEAIAANIEDSFSVQEEQVFTANRTVSKNAVDLDKSCAIC